MTNQDLVELIAADSGLTKLQADRALNSLATSLSNALKNNEEVYISGIGTFTTSRIPAEGDSSSAAQGSANIGTTRIPQFEPVTDLLAAVR
ncbi:MAG: HU family DNA-binding protein [Candidatus Marinimicrobia bacterium]|nr:HU family DNA-binding protein [Candidatus Neomarinimicrobiota bacterium]